MSRASEDSASTGRGSRRISFVIPVFNEEETLPALHRRMCGVVRMFGERFGMRPEEVEVLLVDDGSSDRSWELMCRMARLRPFYRVVSLSRNFGQRPATTAGLSLSRGEFVVTMDADLQDPPELAAAMYELHLQGWDVVHARRRRRLGESAFKRFTAYVYYRLLASLTSLELPPDVGDFRGMGARAVERLLELKEHNQYMKGMICWIGFRQTCVEYERSPRLRGETKYSLLKLMRIAWNGITSFSTMPLMLPYLFSLLWCVAGVVCLAAALLASAWWWLAALVCAAACTLLLCLGIMGEYVGRINDEVKGRPLYIIDAVVDGGDPGGEAAEPGSAPGEAKEDGGGR